MAKWIFNRNGHAAALDCENVIRDKQGVVRLWVDSNVLYDLSGNHVGWTEGGVFYDINNKTIGFTNDHTGHIPSIPGIGAIPAMPAMKAIPAIAAFKTIQARPGFGGWAETLFESYISED